MRQQDLIEKQKEQARRGKDQPDTRSESGSMKGETILSRRSSTSSEKKRGKSMTRSKSPWSSFRFKKSKKEEAAMRTIEHADGALEGMLVRKHEWESTTKKASNRSWEKLCVVLKGSQIMFYKDQKTYRGKPEDTFRGELPVVLPH